MHEIFFQDSEIFLFACNMTLVFTSTYFHDICNCISWRQILTASFIKISLPIDIYFWSICQIQNDSSVEIAHFTIPYPKCNFTVEQYTRGNNDGTNLFLYYVILNLFYMLSFSFAPDEIWERSQNSISKLYLSILLQKNHRSCLQEAEVTVDNLFHGHNWLLEVLKTWTEWANYALTQEF